jgi:hypothetical protein
MQQSSVGGIGKSDASTALWFAFVCALVPVACLVIPIYVIRPFRRQGARELAFALTVRAAAPWLTAVCVIAVLWILFSVLRRKTGTLARIALVALSFIALISAVLTHVNIFEIMFHPYPSPAFGEAGTAKVDADDRVLAVRIGAVAHAYPVLIMGYHHIVNDQVADVPIAATYCTLCHAGLVWNRVVDGKTLYFRLAGINNGNALMRDEQTGSIWQQSTGQAIFGPLKGSQLKLIRSDELTFGLWRKEQPHGLVLRPDAPYATEYESRDWEAHVEKTPTVVDTGRTGILPHALMLGLTASGQSKAYPVKSILAAKIIQDRIAGDSIVILVGPDHTSVRVFQARTSEEPLTFLPVADADQSSGDGLMYDAGTASVWNFQGCAIRGQLAGHCLVQLDASKDYWFDWMNHHPTTAVFRN